MKRGCDGFTLMPWVIIMLMLGSLLWLLNRLTRDLQEAEGCRRRLERIHHVLALYEREHGHLPSFELFAEDPANDPESLLNVLVPYGLKPEWLVCPAAPPVLRAHGMTYLWNTALNQGSLERHGESTWVLVDVQALDDSVNGPHFRGYNVLHSDGKVERNPRPPNGLPVQFD